MQAKANAPDGNRRGQKQVGTDDIHKDPSRQLHGTVKHQEHRIQVTQVLGCQVISITEVRLEHTEHITMDIKEPRRETTDRKNLPTYVARSCIVISTFIWPGSGM